MRAITFWKTMTLDQTDFLDRLLALLADHGIRFCVVGGHAVNAYVEPLVSLDLDLAVAVAQTERLEMLLRQIFTVERLPQGLHVSDPGSDLRVQLQSSPRCEDFVDRASIREVLGLRLPVAQLEDVLQGKIWAATDSSRRPSKRHKDLTDIARLLEAYPHLRAHVPEELLMKLV